MVVRMLAFCALLTVVSSAYGDIFVDLRPDYSPPYDPGEVVNVEVWFVDKDNGHPITHEDILFRGYRLDFADTSETLKLPDQMNLETDPYGINTLFPGLPRPSLIYPLTSENPMLQMTLPAGGEMLVGDVDVTINGHGLLDVMNRDDPDTANHGAWVRFGFGTGPDDPVINWHAYNDGGLNGGRWVPEPGSILLLAIVGLTSLRRRRRT